MKNTTTAPTTTVSTLHTCAVCKQTGSVGAKWNFFIGDSQTPQKVHKPCGEMLQKSAPEGVRTALIPSPGLRDEWRKERLARQAKSLWDTAFADAKPIKAALAKESKPVLKTVTISPPMTVLPAPAIAA